MDITLRPAVENDFPAIVEMFREFAHFEHLDERLTNTVERMKAETEYFNCFVAVKDDTEIVGYATYFFSYFTWTGKSLYMDDLYVRESYRGAGIGKLLINKAVSYTHLRAHETRHDLVCRLLLEKKNISGHHRTL